MTTLAQEFAIIAAQHAERMRMMAELDLLRILYLSRNRKRTFREALQVNKIVTRYGSLAHYLEKP